MVSIFGAMVLAIGTHAFWLWRVEARCGVWFRYADRTATKPVSYIRQPGVTPEAATDALARACSVRAVPLARQLFFLVLMMSLCSVPLGAAVILEVWLPGQWLPG
jgi:hypothetical protein